MTDDTFDAPLEIVRRAQRRLGLVAHETGIELTASDVDDICRAEQSLHELERGLLDERTKADLKNL